MGKRGHVLLIAVPITLPVYFNSSLAYERPPTLSRRWES